VVTVACEKTALAKNELETKKIKVNNPDLGRNIFILT
jgi:hypothetical protein